MTAPKWFCTCSLLTVQQRLAVHWPDGIRATGEQRGQFTDVIDVAPTVHEAVGFPEPHTVNGVLQVPIQGTSVV